MMIHLDGRLVAAAKARIDPADRGLTLGDGLFETLRAGADGIARLDAHLRRLRHGARVLGIPVPISDDDLARAFRQTLDANGLGDGVVRMTLTRGPGGRGVAPPAQPRPTLMITAQPLPEDANRPLDAVIATVTRRNEHSPLARVKSLNYLDNILARREAQERGADDAILLNTAGRLAETTVANLFVVIDGRAVTPPVAEGALPGTMRGAVIAAGADERPLAAGDLARASEAFVTNSLGLRGLTSVDGTAIGDGRSGPVLDRLREIVESRENAYRDTPMK